MLVFVPNIISRNASLENPLPPALLTYELVDPFRDRGDRGRMGENASIVVV